jgi:hypothetical protein
LDNDFTTSERRSSHGEDPSGRSRFQPGLPQSVAASLQVLDATTQKGKTMRLAVLAVSGQLTLAVAVAGSVD